jgi:tetratricopeptide (TPR) repeat protein
MADDRRPDDPRRRSGPADSDTLNLLRDLRSLRDAVPDPVMKRVSDPEPEKPSGPPRRAVVIILLVVLAVIGLSSHFGGQNPTDGHSGSASTGSPEGSGNGESSSGTAIQPRPEDGAVTSIADLGMRHALCQWLLRFYDARVPVALRFRGLPPGETIPVFLGSALLFGRSVKEELDELSLVERTLEPSTGPTRTALQNWLIRSTFPGRGVLENALGALTSGEPVLARKLLAGGAIPANAPHREVALFISHCLAGDDPSVAESGLTGVKDPLAAVIRAHLAVAQEHRDQAATLLQEATSKALDPADRFLAAGLAYRLGKSDLVETLLAKLPASHRETPAAMYARGLAAQKATKWAKARELYTHAAESNWTEPSLAAAALVHRGLVNQEDGRLDAANTDLSAAEDKDPKADHLLVARARAALRGQRYRDALSFGPDIENVSSVLDSFEKLTDPATSRHAFALLPEIQVSAHLPEATKQRLDKMVERLKDKFSPKKNPDEK